MNELMQIKGIGPKTAEMLAALARPVTTLNDLILANADYLAPLLDGVVGLEQVRDWQRQASQIVSERGLGPLDAAGAASGDPKTKVPDQCVNCFAEGTVELNEVFVCSACGFQWPVGWREGV